MSDLDDFQLDGGREEAEAEPTPEPAPPRPPRDRMLIAGVVAIVALALAGGAFFLLTWRPAPPPPPAATPPPTPTPSAPPSVEPTPSALPLPSLDESDALVRELASGLASSPLLKRFLQTSGLVRALTAAVAAVAEGRNPAQLVPALQPTGTFATVATAGGPRVIAVASEVRYDALAAAASALDARACAEVYRRVQPLFEAAYRELGYPAGGFDRVLARAITVLLRTPVPEGELSVEPKGALWAFADPELEALVPAQKQLLRMGPENERKVQAKLRELQQALGLGAAPAATPPPAS